MIAGLLLAGLAPVSPASAQAGAAPVAAEPPPAEPSREPAAESAEQATAHAAERLAARAFELAELGSAELRVAVQAGLEAEPEATRDALVLRAGRPVPPGLSAARQGERETRRREAQTLLRELLADPEQGPAWRVHLEERLAAPDASPLLWTAAARAAGEIGAYGLGEAIAGGLAPGRAPAVRAAARVALHRLHLRWFDDPESFRVAWVKAGARAPDALSVETAQELDRVARARLVRLVELDPKLALEALSSERLDPDPAIRQAAARVLGTAAGGGAVRAEEVVPVLLARLGAEYDPRAFHATLSVLLELLAGAPVDGREVRALRQILHAKLVACDVGLQRSVAHGLGRVPWALEPAGMDSVLNGIDLVAAQLDGLWDSPEPADPDVLVGALQALHTLGTRAAGLGAAYRERATKARVPILALLAEPRVFGDVRVAAAAAVALFAEPEDVEVLVAALGRQGATTDLCYNLLGSLGRLAQDLEPAEDAPVAVLLVDALVAHVRHDNADLRRRALDVLAEPAVASLCAQRDPAELLARLRVEPVPDLQGRLLGLLGTFADRAAAEPDRARRDELRGRLHELLGELLDSPVLDELGRGDPTRIARLAETCRKLAGGDPALTMSAARRLLTVVDGGRVNGSGEPAGGAVARMQQSLALVASLSEADARRLLAAEHAEILGWALRLREAGGRIAQTTPEGAPLLLRLADLHLPATEGEGRTAADNAHELALLVGDYATQLAANGEKEAPLARAEEAFGLALAHALEHGGDRESLSVRLHRARFRAARGDVAGALEDYGTLLDAEDRARETAEAAEATEGAAEGRAHEAGAATAQTVSVAAVTELSDLRRVADLVMQQADGPLGSERQKTAAAKAFDLGLRLLSRPAWLVEPEARRAEDLAQLVDRAVRSTDPDRVRRVADLLASVPPLGGEGVEASRAQGEGLLAGHYEDRSTHQRLLDLRAELAAVTRPAAPEPAPPAAEEPRSVDSPPSGDRAGTAPRTQPLSGGVERPTAGPRRR